MSLIFNNPQATFPAVFFLTVGGSVPQRTLSIERRANWDNDTDVKSFIAQFQESTSLQDAKTDIERHSFRGKGSVVYYHPSYNGKRDHITLNTFDSEFVPEGYALVAYEGEQHFDCGFIVSETQGIILNDNHLGYARLVKLQD